ncbi:hypothetical protein O181_005491 [Austropuccinia psidii MF-1]|uniref:Uncharacterized protein n=1 Tax=Austropuccinia psidii MF-1 TaxID=1389203 RepID=A0A9Q3GFY2_9BASI|nr:hypothetical protein [Austropuccinia psidii MF-1]
MTITYKEVKIHTYADGVSQWPLENVKSNRDFDPEVAANIPIHFMEIDRKKNLILFEWAPASVIPDTHQSESEEIETPILVTISSELQNELFNSVIKAYAKYKQCSICLQLLQKKYRSPELESQLEEPWFRDYKDNKFLLIDGLFYHREKDTSSSH